MLNKQHDLKSVLKFTIPLILSELSINLMFTINRAVLAYYSVDAMNAATIAGNFVVIATFAVISVSQIANVFVGQYNGKGELEKTALPVWQMIYLGLMSFVIFLPIAFSSEYFYIAPEYYKADVIAYQKIMMAFAGFPAIICAISAFFIGRGQTLIIVAVFAISNFINFLLSMLFVFGVSGIIPSMGVAGAAFATITSEAIQILILLCIFLQKKNRIIYKTGDFSFRKDLFWNCVKVGLPISIGKFIELLAWFTLLLLFSYASRDLSTLESVAVSLFVIFIFFADGCSRSIAAISANLIGNNKSSEVEHLLKIFLKFNFIMAGIFAIPLLFRHELIFFFLDKATGDIWHLHSQFKFLFVCMWIIILFDGIFHIISGVLTAGGDTKFQMFLESLTAWVFIVTPAAILYYFHQLTSIYFVYSILCIRSMVNSYIIYKRYKSGKWIKKLV